MRFVDGAGEDDVDLAWSAAAVCIVAPARFVRRDVKRVVDNDRLHTESLPQVVTQDFVRGNDTGGAFHHQWLETSSPECGDRIVPLAVRVMVENICEEWNAGSSAREITGGQVHNVARASHDRGASLAPDDICYAAPVLEDGERKVDALAQRPQAETMSPLEPEGRRQEVILAR